MICYAFGKWQLCFGLGQVCIGRVVAMRTDSFSYEKNQKKFVREVIVDNKSVILFAYLVILNLVK